MIIKVTRTTPTSPKLSTRKSTNQELTHNRERGNSNWFKPYKGVLLYPHNARTMRLTQLITLDEGVLATTFSNKAQPLNIRPSLRGESPRSIGDIPKPLSISPLATYLGPCINDQVYKVFGSSFPLFRICGNTISCSKPTSSTNGP